MINASAARLASFLVSGVLVAVVTVPAAVPALAADGVTPVPVPATAVIEGLESDGYLVTPSRVSLLAELRSLVTTGARVDPLDRLETAVRAAGGSVEDRLESAGLLVVDVDEAGAAALARAGAVATIEPNRIVRLGVRVASESTPASWGLAVLDRDYRTAGLTSTYRTTSDGSGVDIYIVDSGILTSHPDFAGRIPTPPQGGWFAVSGDTVAATADCNGHGTHVAGTAAGNHSGVAPGANLIPVKVFPGCGRTGTFAQIVAGLQWILDRVPAGGLARPSVVNLSLGGLTADFFYYDSGGVRYFYAVPSVTNSLNLKVQQLIDAGFTVVVAAGNDTWPTEWYSPAVVADAITVGSLGRRESGGNIGNVAGDAILPGSSPRFGANIESTFSNFGPVIDLFAPGHEIVSACSAANRLAAAEATAPCVSVTVDGATFAALSISGTSMAAPHVAGVAARILADRFARDGQIMTQAAVRSALVDGALPVVRALEADRAAPGITFDVGGVLYSRSLAQFRNLDGTANVVFDSTDRMLNSVFAEPAGPSGVDLPVPVLQGCIGEVSGPLAPVASSGVAPFSWSVSAQVASGYLSSRGVIVGPLSFAEVGDAVVTAEDAFGRVASRSLAVSLLPPGCVED